MAKVWIDQQFGTKTSKTRGDRMKWTRRFLVDGISGYDSSDEETRAYTSIRSFIVSKFPVFDTQRIQSLEVSECEAGSGLWRGECTFISPTAKQLLEQSAKGGKGGTALPEYSFSTKGGTAHINHSRKTVGVYPGYHPEYEYVEDENGKKTLRYKRDTEGKLTTAREAAPNFHCGIGWNAENGSFDGVDIIVPSWSSTLKLTVSDEYIDQGYLKMLRLLTGAVNSKSFDGMAPGECQFVGCDGVRRVQPTEDNGAGGNESYATSFELVWDLTFEFRGAPNARKWLDGIGYVNKRGWDYVHVLRRNADYQLSDLDIPEKPADIDPDVTQNTDTSTGNGPSATQTTDTNTESKPSEPGMSISVPVAAYVEQVYPHADFQVLGIDL